MDNSTESIHKEAVSLEGVQPVLNTKDENQPKETKTGRPADMYTVDGITDTVKGHAERYKISVSLVRNRLGRDWGIEDALRTPVSVHREQRVDIEYKGYTGSIRGIAKHFNLSYQGVMLRIRKGMDVQEALMRSDPDEKWRFTGDKKWCTNLGKEDADAVSETAVVAEIVPSDAVSAEVNPSEDALSESGIIEVKSSDVVPEPMVNQTPDSNADAEFLLNKIDRGINAVVELVSAQNAVIETLYKDFETYKSVIESRGTESSLVDAVPNFENRLGNVTISVDTLRKLSCNEIEVKSPRVVATKEEERNVVETPRVVDEPKPSEVSKLIEALGTVTTPRVVGTPRVVEEPLVGKIPMGVKAPRVTEAPKPVEAPKVATPRNIIREEPKAPAKELDTTVRIVALRKGNSGGLCGKLQKPEYTVLGKTGTLVELCSIFDLDYTSVTRRITCGSKPESAIKDEYNEVRKSKSKKDSDADPVGETTKVTRDMLKYNVRGFYGTITQLSRSLHFSGNKTKQVRALMAEGVPVEEAFNIVIRDNGGTGKILYVYRGVEGTPEQLACRFNKRCSDVEANLDKAMPIDKALELAKDIGG